MVKTTKLNEVLPPGSYLLCKLLIILCQILIQLLIAIRTTILHQILDNIKGVEQLVRGVRIKYLLPVFFFFISYTVEFCDFLEGSL